MDTGALRKAYADLLDEIAAGGFGPPPAGEWTAAQVVAHVIANDELLAEATRAVLAGEPRPYANHAVIDPARLAEFGDDLDGLAARAHLPSHTEQLRALRDQAAVQR